MVAPVRYYFWGMAELKNVGVDFPLSAPHPYPKTKVLLIHLSARWRWVVSHLAW